MLAALGTLPVGMISAWAIQVFQTFQSPFSTAHPPPPPDLAIKRLQP